MSTKRRYIIMVLLAILAVYVCSYSVLSRMGMTVDLVCDDGTDLDLFTFWTPDWALAANALPPPADEDQPVLRGIFYPLVLADAVLFLRYHTHDVETGMIQLSPSEEVGFVIVGGRYMATQQGGGHIVGYTNADYS